MFLLRVAREKNEPQKAPKARHKGQSPVDPEAPRLGDECSPRFVEGLSLSSAAQWIFMEKKVILLWWVEFKGEPFEKGRKHGSHWATG